ncbi:MAG: transposase [Flavobacterium sp.]|nr:transposase [Flavobacterium sp.]
MGKYFQVDGKKLHQQYKDHLSGFKQWKQLSHAEDWMLFPKNLGPFLSIDETALSQGELYTIIINKQAHGKKGSIVAMVKGTSANDVIKVLRRIPQKDREMVKEVTLDMAPSMEKIIASSFSKAIQVTDRFHVQKLVYDAVQEIRIKYRWEAIELENIKIQNARKTGKKYVPEELKNGDTLKQLLARSRYLLFKNCQKWTNSQEQRALILFQKYPLLEKVYNLAMRLGQIFSNSASKTEAFNKLAFWFKEVEDLDLKSFQTVLRSFQMHYETILNFFNNRSTNAAAESFNAKIKSLRAASRGVSDVSFFLFRLAKLYA